MPVCLWNTSQLALTVNAGKTKLPKLGSKGRGGRGVEGGRLVMVIIIQLGEDAVKMSCMQLVDFGDGGWQSEADFHRVITV